MTESTESRLAQECFMHFHNTYPEYRGLYFVINNNSRSREAAVKNKAMGLQRGVADVCLLLPYGRGPVFIEFKTPTGKQSPAQINWETIIGKEGYKYYIVRSLEEFKTLINSCLQD